MKARSPLKVIVTWDDAVSETSSIAHWEWTPEAIEKIGQKIDLVRGRTTIGWLGYVDAEKTILFHDFDDDNDLGNSTTIHTGWITKITTVSGRLIYRRTG